ncbi:hypothetical protein [Haloarchaeobius sp. HME9146]|uniref:hypothetical protein n=1 Tax=unclassified Haloarchaeobius TaxID=2614452 RepID=UPI0021BEEC83|nr:hypothetical protein [Haloarchaeobius sp. HME9146]MCT9097558.1 hypothetical protein [Haloarchaeobius sp. HME9146]
MDTQPTLDAGLTLLDTPDARSTALHRLVVRTLAGEAGTTYWVDARNTAATYVLAELADSDRLLDRIQVARAFTAYQHHELVRELVRRVDGRTAMVVCPNLGALYRDPDVPDAEAADLLEGSVAVLADLARACDVPVLVTARDDAAEQVAAVADRELDCTRTRMGFRYEGEDFETAAYPVPGGWQTTIPYWVDLFGAVTDAGIAVDTDPTVADLLARA